MIGFMLQASCSSRPEIDTELKKELAEILASDQKYRSYMGKVHRDTAFRDSLVRTWNIPGDSLMSEIWNRQLKIDSLNLIKVTGIIAEHGYPGKTLVGENEHTAAWYVLQHAPLEYMEQHFPLIRKAAEEGELPKRLAGMMEDRMLMYRGKEQLYGTQGQSIVLKTGERKLIIWPIKDPENVNKRRRDMGFEDSVEENARHLGIEYVPYTLQEVKEMAVELPYPR